MVAPAAKSATATKGKPRGKPWPKGVSGNPAGAPKRGQSWRELIAELGELDGPAAAARAGFLAKQFGKLTPGVTLKELVVLRVFSALIDDPQPGLLNAFMERVEGKVAQAIEMEVKEKTAFDYSAAVAAIAGRSGGDSETPGDGEDSSERPALGQISHGGDDGPSDG